MQYITGEPLKESAENLIMFVAAIGEMLRRGVYPMVIKRNNIKDKNADLDRWLTKLRSLYEGALSKQNKRVHYKDTVKNQGAKFLYAMAYNFRRLPVLNPE